jgi:hypothetical protein
MKAPLLSGTDISRASSDTIATLTAAEVIGVSQDKLGVQVRHHDGIRGNMGFCTRGDCAIVSDGGHAWLDVGNGSQRAQRQGWIALGRAAGQQMHDGVGAQPGDNCVPHARDVGPDWNPGRHQNDRAGSLGEARRWRRTDKPGCQHPACT